MKSEAARSSEKTTVNEKWLEARLRYLMRKTNRWRPSGHVNYVSEVRPTRELAKSTQS